MIKMTDEDIIIKSNFSDCNENVNIDGLNENSECIQTVKNLDNNFNEEKIIILDEKIILLESQKKILQEETEFLNNTITNLKSEFRLKNEQLMKAYDDAKRDKESMVLKFAQSEQKNMESLRKIKELEGRLRERNNIVDQLNNEKDKLNKELRSRASDYSSYEKELNNLKVSLSIAEQKLKNEDLKFKEEVERNKDIRKKYEDLNRNILVMKEENSTLRSNCQEIVKTYQDSEDMRSNSLTSSLKQTKEELKKCTDEKKEALDNLNKINAELQSTKSTVHNQLQEIRTLKDKMKHAEADRMCQDETVKQLKDAIKSLNFVKDQLNERISHLEPFESQITQLTQDRSKLTASNEELKRIADESESQIVTLRQKESELLEFIQSLSSKNAQLQMEKQELTKENDKAQQQIARFEQKYKEAFIKITFWEEKSKSESKIWLAEKDKYIKEIVGLKSEIGLVNQKLVDNEDQIYSLNKRHKAHIKDLTRQLTKSGTMDICKQSLQRYPVKVNLKNDKTKSSSYSTSDESQNSTLNLNDTDEVVDNEIPKVSRDKTQVFTPHSSVNKNAPDQTDKTPVATLSETPEIHMIEPHNQVLIEKIVKLQRLNAKLQDKIDFLGEHTAQLTQEIQKKTFLLKYLFSQTEEKGSVKSDTIDENHFMMSKKGGIMASVYSSRQVDESMTLELSLEISRRLQSVLEDTTIKNITLKESINTLGEEISRLNEENRTLKTHNHSV